MATLLLKAGTPEKIDTNPIGTGPFEFVGFQPEVAVRYRAFADYWGGKAADRHAGLLDHAERLRAPHQAEGRRMPRHGVPDARRPRRDRSRSEPEVSVEQEGFNIGYLAMNTSKPPFDDVRVRRAINMAIDKAAIIEAVYQGAGVVAKNPIPPTLPAYNDDIEDYPYDPAAAQQLMIEAGLAEGFDTDLWYIPVSRPYNPNGKRVAELIQYDLAKIGIRANLVSDEWSAYRQKLQDGETSMALYGWTGDNGDPDNFLDVLLGCTAARIGGNNIARWCNRDYDKLVNDAKLITDQDARTQALSRGAGHLPRRRAVGAARPFGGVHGDARQRHRLQDGPARPARLRGRGFAE